MRRFFVAGALLVLGGSAGEARLVTVTVLNTTDIHGSIRATPGVYAENNHGSLLRCARIVRRIRAENPHALLLDGGDIFQGTAESFLTRGGVMATAMNVLGYDAFAIGNHEFDWGVETLAEMLDRMAARPLAANLLAGPEAPVAFRRVAPYIVKELDGVKVAVVGLTTPNLPNWFVGLRAQGLTVLDSRRGLELALPQVRRERPQILILLVHQGLLARDDEANEIQGICRRFGEFDLVLGGHLHWTLAGARIGKVDYAQAGSGANGVLRVDLVFDTVQNAVVDKRFEYIPVTSRLKEDPEIVAQVSNDLARADAWLDTVIGRTRSDLTYSPAVPGLCPVQQLLCRAIAEATGAEVVLHGILSGISLPAGDLRVADIWKIVPYENTVGCLWLTLGEIHAIMEEAAVYLGEDRYFGSWGLSYEVHAYAPEGRRIRNLRAADGTAINGRRRIKVAVNSYHLAGGGGRFPTLVKAATTPNCRLEMMAATPTRDMVISYVRRHRSLDIPAGTNALVLRAAPKRWQRKPAP